MNKFFRATAALGAIFALAQSAIALTSTQRDIHSVQMLANVGAVTTPCEITPDYGYGLVCANSPRSSVALTRAWDLYASSDAKVSTNALRATPWEVEGSRISAIFVTEDGDYYVVVISENRESTVLIVLWGLLPSDGNPARFGLLKKPSNTVATAQLTGTKPPVLPPLTSQVGTPAISSPVIPPIAALPAEPPPLIPQVTIPLLTRPAPQIATPAVSPQPTPPPTPPAVSPPPPTPSLAASPAPPTPPLVPLTPSILPAPLASQTPIAKVTTPAVTPATNPDLLTLEKYVQDNSLLYQGFVAGTTLQGALSSSQNAFFLIALGEKFPGSGVMLKTVDELQATLSLGTQTITLKKR